MWHCQNCGYSDETGDSFEEEKGAEGEVVRYCPECGSDEVFMLDDEEVDDFEDEEEDDEDFEDDDEDDDDDDEDWDDEDFDVDEEEEEEEDW